MGGRAFTELADALSFMEWAKGRPNKIKDLYFCLSLQEKAEPTDNGKLKTLRAITSALALKAIWLDIDCNKEPPKGYRCKEDGLKALKEFCDATRIPYPNAIIDFGQWPPYLLDLGQAANREGVVRICRGARRAGHAAWTIARCHHH